MALRFKSNSLLRVKKLAGALIAIAAFLLQPFTVINLQTAFAATPSDVWITAAMPNPTGVDANGEYITLENQTASPVDLSGWKIDDGGTAGTLSGTIAASGTYKLCADASVSSTATGCDGQWSGMSLVNTGDTITLTDGTTTIDQVSYSSSTEGSEVTFSTHTPVPVPVSVTACAAGCDYTSLQAAINAVASGGTVTLASNLATTSQVTISKPLTINGAGYTLAPGFAKSDNSNNAAIGVIGASGVTIQNLTIDGTLGTNLHGVNLYEVSNTQLNNLNIHDNDRYGVVVNSSDITINSITTSGNGWGGINVDMVTQPASATMAGVNSQDEFNALFVEGSGASITDSTTGQQYYEYPAGSGVYHTKTSDLGSVVNTTSHKAYDTIQAAINDSATQAGDVINVSAGSYVENVNVSKAVTLQGAGANVTEIVATNGNATPLFFSGSNATVDGFTITHDYTPSELSAWSFNNNGVQFGQLTTGNTVSNSLITLNRNGVYINNAQGNALIDNIIADNRTGINMTNNVNDTEIIGNVITENWTIGLVMYTATPSLTTDLSTMTVSDNIFDQNWYTEVLVKDANFSGALELSDNDFTDDPVTYSTSDSASLNEPGFGAQKPVGLGDGTAVKPAQEYPTLRIYNSPNASLSYSTDELEVGDDDYVLANDDVVVTIPQDAVITPTDAGSWNGVVSAPHTVTTGVNLPSGNTLGLAIEVGSPDTTLTFSKVVKLVFPGQAGKLVGWQAPGSSTFTPITTDCSTYLPDLDAGMPVGGDCKTTDGTDLVIWTKHFTTFATYTVATTNGGGSGNGSGGSSTTVSPAPTPTTIFGGVFNVTPNQGTTSGNGIKDDDGEILGTNTVPRKTTASASAKNSDGIILGLAWYWWLAILAALGLVWWVVSAWRTRRSDTF